MLTYLKLLGAVVAWGGTFIAAKYAILDTSVEMAALLRFILASLALLIILYLQLGRLPRLNRQQLFYIVLLGMTGVAAYNLFFFSGLQTVEAGRGALIIASNPIWTTIGSIWFFKQRFSALNLLGLLICSVGVTVVLSRDDFSTLFSKGVGVGELAILGCAVSWAAYTLLGKKLMHADQALDPLTLVTYSCISGSVLLALWIAVTGQPVTTHISFNLVSSIAYLALLGTVAGFVWYFQGVKEIGAAQGAVFVFLVPVSAIILGNLLLDEAITLSLLVGGTLIIGGVALVNKPASPNS